MQVCTGVSELPPKKVTWSHVAMRTHVALKLGNSEKYVLTSAEALFRIGAS